VAVLAGGAHPGPAHANAPPAEGDRAGLDTVPHRDPSRVVLAPRPGHLGHLHGHQLVHDLQADRGRGGQQPLAHVGHEAGQVLIQAAGQPLGQPDGSR